MIETPETSPGKDNLTLAKALDDFKPIANPFFKWTLEVLPVFIITFLLADTLVIHFLDRDVMTQTGLVAAGIANYLLIAQLQGISEMLRTLWKRGAILSARRKDNMVTNGFSNLLLKMLPEKWHREKKQPEAGQSLEEYYLAYVNGFQRWLNHKASWVLGLIFAAIMSASFLYRWQKYYEINWYSRDMLVLMSRINFTSWAGILGEIMLAYVIGLLAWRMLVVALQVSRLDYHFDLDIKVQHPDKSGGLRPLGDLCFINALVITVPSVYLGLWVILIPRVEEFGGYAIWITFFSQLLIFMFILAVFAFFQPLYSIHRAMVRRRSSIQGQLDELSKQIDDMTKKLLDEVDTIGTEESEELKKKIAILQQIYESNSNIPVWPFDRALILKFASAQAIPLLSMTNIGPSILDLLGSLLKFLQ